MEVTSTRTKSHTDILSEEIITENFSQISNANFDHTTMSMLQLTSKKLYKTVKKMVAYKVHKEFLLEARICNICNNHDFGQLLPDIMNNTNVDKIAMANVLVKHGKCKDLDWLLHTFENNFTSWQPSLKSAAKNSRDMLNYVFDKNPHWSKTNVECNSAAGAGKLECLHFICEKGGGKYWDEVTCEKAAENGSVECLECLEYLHTHGCPWNESTCDIAAANGNIECLQYAYENGCPWNELTCEAAVGGDGKLLKKNEYNLFQKHKIIKRRYECLKYAHEHGCPWNKNVCNVAAYYGKLRCLKYLHRNGCPWDDYKTCECAAGTGKYKCLKYAHKHGCSFNYHAICVAIVYGENSKCIKYLFKHYDDVSKKSVPFSKKHSIDDNDNDDNSDNDNDDTNSDDNDDSSSNDCSDDDDDECDKEMIDCCEYGDVDLSSIPQNNGEIDENTMKYIIEYAEHHCGGSKKTTKILLNEKMDIIIDEWDGQFMKKLLDSNNIKLLLSIINASKVLMIDKLYKLACAIVASVIIGKLPEQIRNMFNIKNDFTPDEYANAIRQINWIC